MTRERPHRVILRNEPAYCYAWCSTCYWRGPRVKRMSTAQRWADRHAPPHEGRHRAT